MTSWQIDYIKSVCVCGGVAIKNAVIFVIMVCSRSDMCPHNMLSQVNPTPGKASHGSVLARAENVFRETFKFHTAITSVIILGY